VTKLLRQHVGDALRRARQARAMSVSDLARASGVAKATQYALE
jgi:transcriptional regulator with XRE-family HTH domain